MTHLPAPSFVIPLSSPGPLASRVVHNARAYQHAVSSTASQLNHVQSRSLTQFCFSPMGSPFDKKISMSAISSLNYTRDMFSSCGNKQFLMERSAFFVPPPRVSGLGSSRIQADSPSSFCPVECAANQSGLAAGYTSLRVTEEERYVQVQDDLENVKRSAWEAADLYRDTGLWKYYLSPDDIADICRVIDALKAAKPDDVSIEDYVPTLSKEDFPFSPSLTAVLEHMKDELIYGRGFYMIKNMPVPPEWSREDVVVAYWGLGVHLGMPRCNNGKGHVLCHIKDITTVTGDEPVRLYMTNSAQRFHTDECDIVGLLCLKQAMEGGHSSVASAVNVYKEMQKTRPDLLEELLSPDIYWDRKGEVPQGALPYFTGAIYIWYKGRLITTYDRTYFLSAQRFDEVPRLTPKQVEALDLFEALAADDRFRLDMVLAPGDIQFVHNHQVLHARTAYTDFAHPADRRHLLRLWLETPDGLPLPSSVTSRYGDGAERRWGINLPGVRLHAPLEAS